ncbi:hypothetical protein OsJ_31948 [Oryza sativa Japonica Group]|uniref:Uncharacterized protein n=1 Tax=Oryza sativa subsp. japonica TaxID=39947 RepID=Q8W370_ORYSJ|nr:hypothetical protein [Oryza sativa Japonica Group]EEE51169.1 hypothetical protein OsJ_31948 [Oryza sativa Japonica Group]
MDGRRSKMAATTTVRSTTAVAPEPTRMVGGQRATAVALELSRLGWEEVEDGSDDDGGVDNGGGSRALPLWIGGG